MQGLFNKVCLGVIAVSLAVIAGTNLMTVNTEPVARTETASLVTPDVETVPQPEASATLQTVENTASRKERRACNRKVAELETTLSTLQEQIANVPATIEEKGEGFSKETPNRLYEQLMFNIIDTRTRIKVQKSRCDALT